MRLPPRELDVSSGSVSADAARPVSRERRRRRDRYRAYACCSSL